MPESIFQAALRKALIEEPEHVLLARSRILETFWRPSRKGPLAQVKRLLSAETRHPRSEHKESE